MNLFSAGISETGPTRPNNEDSILIDSKLNLFILADGMGGHQGGAVASSLSAKYLHEALRAISISIDANLDSLLTNAISDVNSRIFQPQAEQPHNQRMGSTLVAAWFLGDRLLLGNVGDSRCYRYRNGRLSQLTIDHTLWEKIRDNEATITSDAKRVFRSTLTKVIGTQARIVADVGLEKLRAGDRFLICSDGITNELTGLDITKIFNITSSVDDTAKMLISEATGRNAKDNISVIVIEVEGTTPSTVRFSKNAGPIRRRLASPVTVLLLVLLLFLSVYAWNITHEGKDKRSIALLSLAEGNYPAAQVSFEELLNAATDTNFEKLYYRLAVLMSIWYQQSDSASTYNLAINALMDAEILNADISNVSIWPEKPPDDLLNLLREAARSRWDRHLAKGISDTISQLEGDASIRMKIRFEETTELYCSKLKTGKALKELNNIQKELSNERK